MEVNARLGLPANPEHLREVRRVVRTLAEASGATPERVDDIVIAVSEACSNVVAHAYAEDGGDMHVLVDRRADDIVFVVSDSGKPIIDKRPGGAGLGLALIRNLSDSVTIEGPGDAGTVVVMTFALAR